ncbi:MAG: starch-binding protein [Lachnospiraceae bacterium]|nr:starch-binding protein [Lachnospiraceae bacterium]
MHWRKYLGKVAFGVVFAGLTAIAVITPTDIFRDQKVSTKQELENNIVLHYRWDGEDTPHLYYENVNGNGEQVISWPGIPMKKTGDNWYSYTISDVDSADIVFSIGDVYETATLSRTAGEWWFDQDAWYAENPYRDEKESVEYAEVSTKVESKKENTVSNKINTKKEYNKEDVISIEDGKTVVGLREINTVEDYIETYVETQDLSASDDASIIIHYYAKDTVPSIYYWNALPQDMETVWPGQPMTLESENWYTYSFSGVDKINLLFTYGMNQTKDLTRKTGEWWYKNGKWYSKKPADTNPDEKPVETERGDFREETIYFLMTTRFYDGDPANNVHCWDENPRTPEEDPCWRGDFKGLIEKLDYIKALGFSAVWVTPVVENASGLDYHGYHAMNFQKVDPRYESEDVTYQTLINEVHKRGMKIVQDVVFNHTGNFGESNLAPMFEKDPTVEGSYGSIECMKLSEDTLLPDNYYDSSRFEKESDYAGWQYQTRLALMKDHVDPVYEGRKNDPYRYYHNYGHFNWDYFGCQLGQIAGDCVDLNTENPLVAKYITDSYSKYINMGVDAFRVDTVKHISRLSFNNFYNPVLKAVGGENFFMFGEVCARSTEIWYRKQTPALSAPFYTWLESKDYDWVYYDEGVVDAYEQYANEAPQKIRSDFGTDLEYFDWRLESESHLAHGVNIVSTEEHYSDNANDVDEKEVKPAGTAQREQPISRNAFLDGNTYHEPDYSMKAGLDVIDFPMHWAFETAKGAFGNVTRNYDYATGEPIMEGEAASIGGDFAYNDSTWNVVYVDSHDYAPGNQDKERYKGGTEAWAENLSLMFTFRGIPCIYYGSEVEFQAGKVIDNGKETPLFETGRAYFGDYLEGEITASDFGVYEAEAGSAIEETLSKPLCQHLMRLNKIRREIPALQKGQYSLAGIKFSDMAFKRRYTDDSTDSFVLVTITGDATFSDIPNGTYVDAITGDSQTVTNGTLSVEAPGKANMRVYVLDTDLTPAPGKIGNDTDYLK